MRILISGICGFGGSTVAQALPASGRGHQTIGFDQFIRPGSESNRVGRQSLDVKLFHADGRASNHAG